MTRSPCLLDDEIIALKLQLEELDVFTVAMDPKGKRRENEMTDTVAAVRDFSTQIQELLLLLGDTKLARSIDQALESDTDVLRKHLSDELRATTDRQLASRLANLDEDAEHMKAHMAQPILLDDLDAEDGATNSSPTLSLPPSFLCVCCCDDKPKSEMHTVPCGHHYCRHCLLDLFTRSSKDESLFPPRCCQQPIPLDSIVRYMPLEEVRRFNVASIEFSTNNRTYCANLHCSVFIPPNDIHADIAMCGLCRQHTCTICKQKSHVGDCPHDLSIQNTLDMASDKGWRRCSNCQRMVELNLGCNHIKCICRAEWCYLCGASWKTCLCEQFSEEHLLATAENVVDREANGHIALVDRQARVQRVREELRDRHDCTHSRHFERIGPFGKRGRACDTCGQRHALYLLRCRHCHLEVCQECRNNRV